MDRPHGEVLDPVAAYDRIAPFFAHISAERCQYLARIEDLVVERIPRGSLALLDIGAGDGVRAARIASRAGLHEVTLLEPSFEMSKRVPHSVEIWHIRAEDLYGSSRPANRAFDVVTCLWNVLGHIRPSKMRVQVLRELARLVSAKGRIFLDVNHRYNVRSYGPTKTISRFIYDRLSPGNDHGDVTVKWRFNGVSCSTYGHVFTDLEIRSLADAAALTVEEFLVVDYRTGQLRRFGCEGCLFYVLRREV